MVYEQKLFAYDLYTNNKREVAKRRYLGLHCPGNRHFTPLDLHRLHIKTDKLTDKQKRNYFRAEFLSCRINPLFCMCVSLSMTVVKNLLLKCTFCVSITHNSAASPFCKSSVHKMWSLYVLTP